jgi:sulfur relay (sulfurtransferase) complex TusBCD TusD component (DsrE family)
MLFKAGLLDRVRRAAHVMILCSGLPALFPFSAIAASSVTLAWDPSPGTDVITNYNLYYGAASATYTNVVPAGTNTTVTISNLVGGTTYYFAATAVDTNGLESVYSTEVAYTNVTATPPTIVLSSPVNGASYAAPAAINLAATVTANGHTITQVQFYNGATLLGADTSAPYSFAWTNVSAGSYSLTARAVYDSGSTVTSTAATVTVTNVTPPSIALTAPANGASYAAPATINLAATVTANGHTITQVQFYNGATLLATDTSAPYSFAWTNVSAGSYSLTARAVYDSGSTVTSTAASVTVTNVTPPSIALTAPANGASYAAPATINLAATVTANGHTITQVQFYNGATLLGADASAPYSFAWTNVSAGSYSLTAKATYDSGSTVASTAASVTVTNVTPPSIALTAPANGASYAAPATINLAATVTANGHTITQVQFYNGATLLGADASAPYSFAWTNVSAGSYTLTAQAVYDSGSTVASTAANVTVAAARPANTSPAVSAIAPQTMTTNRAQLTIPFTINDPSTTASNLTVSASSSNPALLPNTTNNIGITESGTNCTVTLKPVSGQTGQVDITITVSNVVSSLTTNTTFLLSITEQVAWTLWLQNTCGQLACWFMQGTNCTGGAYLNPSYLDPSWRFAGTGDFNGDGQTDILWQNSCGVLASWFMEGTNAVGGGYLNPYYLDPSWRLAATGDFNGDGKSDILWQNSCGVLACWFMDGTNTIGGGYLNPSYLDPSWRLAGTGDFNGDGTTDILWQNSCGVLACWFMNGTNAIGGGYLNPSYLDPSWKIVGTGDINGDGKTDILLQNTCGELAVWYMDGTNCIGGGYLNPAWVDPSWKVVGPK